MRYRILLTRVQADTLEDIVTLTRKLLYSLSEPVIHDRWTDETMSVEDAELLLSAKAFANL